MKSITLLLFALINFTITSQTSQELQNELKVLEQKIAALNEKLVFCDMYSKTEIVDIKNFNPKFEFKVIGCIGNSSTQTVDVIVTIKHALPNQQMRLNLNNKKPMAYSETGTTYGYKSSLFAGEGESLGSLVFQAPTNLLIQGKITFRNILPQTEKIALVTGGMNNENADGGGDKSEGQFEIRNLTITWE